MLEARGILNILPHRYPFVMVDKILEMETDKYAIGIKNVTINEPFFQGHFPGRPTMPGVLIAETIAQVGGIMLLQSRKETPMIPYLAGIQDLKFRQPVVPGDTLLIEVQMIKAKGNIGKMSGKASVDGKTVAEGVFMFALVEESKAKR